MKIILFGSGGTLGTQLKKVFSEHHIITPTSADLNIVNYTITKAYIKGIHPDLILNAAAYNDVDGAENKEGEVLAFAINAKAVGNIASIANECKALFVHFSTDNVFDGFIKDGFDENAISNPQTIYGQSKLLGEKLILKNTKKYYIIRLSRLFGLKGSSVESKKSFVDIMLKLADTKSELKVVNDTYAKCTYAPDLAHGTKNLIEKKYPYGVYHLVNEGVCTWYQFAQEIFTYTKMSPTLIPVTSKEFPRVANIPTYAILHNTKLPQLRTWQEALKEYMKIIH